MLPKATLFLYTELAEARTKRHGVIPGLFAISSMIAFHMILTGVPFPESVPEGKESIHLLITVIMPSVMIVIWLVAIAGCVRLFLNSGDPPLRKWMATEEGQALLQEGDDLLRRIEDLDRAQRGYKLISDVIEEESLMTPLEQHLVPLQDEVFKEALKLHDRQHASLAPFYEGSRYTNPIEDTDQTNAETAEPQHA